MTPFSFRIGKFVRPLPFKNLRDKRARPPLVMRSGTPMRPPFFLFIDLRCVNHLVFMLAGDCFDIVVSS